MKVVLQSIIDSIKNKVVTTNPMVLSISLILIFSLIVSWFIMNPAEGVALIAFILKFGFDLMMFAIVGTVIFALWYSTNDKIKELQKKWSKQ